tara:strand:- start:81087 stop:83141 length:2055 start_codon:yes stop_codon:yes gene_type:complete
MNYPKRNNFFFQAWATIIPLAAILYLFLSQISPILVSPVNDASISQIFLDYLAYSCSPEPLEQLRYLLAISVVPSIFFIFCFFMHNRGNSSEQTALEYKIWACLAVLAQASLTIFVISMSTHEQLSLKAYFSDAEIKFSSGITLIALFLIVKYRKNLLSWNEQSKIVPISIGIIFSIPWLSTCIFTKDNLGGANFTVASHIHHYTSEILAVMSGKTPMVDYFPQYQSLLSYFLLPYFKFFGFSILSFTSVMAGMSLASLFSVFYVLKVLTNGWWRALILFLPFVAISFYSTFENTPPQPLHAFNYFAMWPLRYFLPCLIFSMLVFCLRSNFRFRFLLLFFLGGIATINNIDHGLPALIGGLVAFLMVILVQMKNRDLAFNLVLQFVVGLVLSFGAIALFNFIRAGSPGDLFNLSFQRIFAVYGFFMLPAPYFGVHWLPYLTFMASLLSGVYLAFTQPNADPTTQLKIALLSYLGIFGPGAMMYYVGRSHPLVLISIFPIWALTVMVLGWIYFEYFTKLKTIKNVYLSIVPMAILLFFYFLFFTQILKMPSLISELKRYQEHDRKNAVIESVEEIKAIIQPKIAKKENVLLLFPYGDLVAQELGVRNVSPYSLVYSIFLKTQILQMMEAAKKYDVAKIALLSPKKSYKNDNPFREWRERFQEYGFRSTFKNEIDGQNFEIWEKGL